MSPSTNACVYHVWRNLPEDNIPSICLARLIAPAHPAKFPELYREKTPKLEIPCGLQFGNCEERFHVLDTGNLLEHLRLNVWQALI